MMKILWDFNIQTDRRLSHNRPVHQTSSQTAFIIDIAIPGDSRKLMRIVKCERYRFED